MDTSIKRMDKAVIRLATIAHLPEVLEELGADTQAVLSAVGLSLAGFKDTEFRVPYSTLGDLLEHGVRSTGCEHFGLLVGQRIFPSALGLLGFLMQSADTVQDALRDYTTHADLQDQGAVSLLNSVNGITILSYSIFAEDVSAEAQIYDGTMAGHLNIMKGLCGESFKPKEIHFSHSRPRDATPFERFFKVPIRYNSEYNAIAFPTRYLASTPVRSDPLLHEFMKQEVEKQRAALPRTVSEQIRPILRRLLIGQSCTLSATAAQLGMHGRTLNRRLQAEGTTFQAEADAARYLMSRQFLVSSQLSVAEIASMIGYSDTSAFSHAFQRWSGTSPSAWRAQKRPNKRSSRNDNQHGSGD